MSRVVGPKLGFNRGVGGGQAEGGRQASQVL